jgi:hypothetical protein
MKDTETSALPSVGALEEMIDSQPTDEKPATEHMKGWALIGLTAAFMSIGFVLALDNTILGLCCVLQPSSDLCG